MLKGITNFLRRKFKRKRIRLNAPAVVFLDNRFPDFFNQIEYLFSSGFLPQGTVVITRHRRLNLKSISAGAARFNAPLYTFTNLASIPLVEPGATIIYPYNAQTNARMMLNRECAHVFVGHGDSNKKASCNPMLRAYDYVLIAGELSRERLIDQGILRPAITREHTIAIGKTVVDQRHANLYSFADAEAGGALAYLPTWEGGFEAENYCSLREANVAPFLIRFAAKLGMRNILLDVHPNLGQRSSEYETHFRSLAVQLLDAGLSISMRQKGSILERSSFVADLVKTERITLFTGTAKLSYAVVDVSAAESIIAAGHIPSAVLKRRETKLYASNRYSLLRNESLIEIQNEASIAKFLDMAGGEKDQKQQIAFSEAIFSHDDPVMASLDAREKWTYLSRNYFHKTGP
ncbi:hypothetical protein [Shinella sp.]|uniref:hypothetical protein n=1 Tax=Shinella sp. TaxID=1870904 RepID=UPI0028A59E9F|nr:hypothetical protein [Shinella sp.]